MNKKLLILVVFSVLKLRFGFAQNIVDGCNYNYYMPLLVSAPNSGLTLSEQTCGILISKDKFKDQPFVYFPDAKDNIEYTLVFIDPDAPGLPANTYNLHWLVSNIPGYVLKTGLGYNIGTTIKDYAPPLPPECSGSHRFIYLVFEQHRVPLRIPIPAERFGFSLTAWLRSIEPYGSLYGPVATSMFLATY